jgi:Rieske Fe-S protein
MKPLPPSRSDRPDRGPLFPPRREILRGAAGLVLVWVSPLPSSAQDARTARPAEGDWLVRIGDDSLTPLTPDDVPAAAKPIHAWPMTADRIVRGGSRLNRVLLVRLDPGSMGDRTRPLAAGGVVAYSAVCTHTGCEVAGWLTEEQLLHCDCHDSRFDPRDNARVIDGPAPRSLPALPLKVIDQRLVVAGPFTSKVGFEVGVGP